jgi:nicotinamidase/pyrazinamidase
MPATTQFGRGSALLLVDIQRDFCAGGALAVPNADAVIPVANCWIEQARAQRVPVIASRDWHPAHHVSFEERGGPWPAHCVQDSSGAAFHPDLVLPADAVVISKGTEADRDAYSAFDATGLAARLRVQGIERIFVCGLALDYCVRATVLDALAAGFEVHLVRDATRAVEVHPGDGENALDEMVRAGAAIEASLG